MADMVRIEWSVGDATGHGDWFPAGLNAYPGASAVAFLTAACADLNKKYPGSTHVLAWGSTVAKWDMKSKSFVFEVAK